MPGTTANRSAPAGADATVREINQQPQVWEDASRAVSEKRDALDAFLGDLLKRDNLRIVLTGAGTSAFVGRIAAPALARKLGRQVDAIATTDIVADPRDSFPEDVPTLLVSFARSGNSPESVAATELADELLTDVSHLIVTCDQSGALYAGHIDRAKSQVLLMPTAANDQGFAMTSSFTSMLLSVLLAFGVADAASAAALASSASDTLASRADLIRDLAASGIDRVVYLGSGALEGLANESALKMLELTAGNVVAYSESALGFRHGPKAILNDRTLVVVYVSSDPYTRLYDLDILNELRTSVAPGKLVAVSATPLELDGAEVWVLPEVANLGDGLAAIAFVVVAQLLALSASMNLGLTPDNPFPGGDVNRVVRGVHIHPLEG